jgi:hypothetical protein
MSDKHFAVTLIFIKLVHKRIFQIAMHSTLSTTIYNFKVIFLKSMCTSLACITEWFLYVCACVCVFWHYWSLNSGLHTCQTDTNHVNHTSSLFCLDYFGNRVSHFSQASLDSDPSILGFPHSWDDECVPPCLVFLCWDGVSVNFFWQGWPGTTILPISASQ